ncbi:MAG: hypothetical protein ACUVUC_10605 [Thermoguttaceae bacterium]
MWTRVCFSAAVAFLAAGLASRQVGLSAADANRPATWQSASDNSGSARSGAAPEAAGAAGAPMPTPGHGVPPVEPSTLTNPTGSEGRTATQPAEAPRATPGTQPPPRRPIARVSAGPGSLPNQHGQLYREYDISPYTLRVTSTNRPEQAIVDWILRETGYEAWHGEPLAILSATPRKLHVYHTPEVQAVVAEVVDRFLNSEAETHAFSLRVVTVDSPNWRIRVQRLLTAVPVQTPGVQAWVLEKEAAALVLADLRRRSDYRERGSPHLLVHNGQSTVVSEMRGRNYVRSLRLRPEAWPGFEPETAVIDEGFTLEFSPLLSLDGRLIDAVFKCEVAQVEKLLPVMLDVPTVAAPRQRVKIEVPQVSQFRFQERFRWPVDKVLLIGLGMIGVPGPSEGIPLIGPIGLPLGVSPTRAEMLLFVESKGKLAAVSQAARGNQPGGRYSEPRR